MSKGNTLIPSLRFPEFVNEGEWEEKKLGEIVSIKSGNSPSKYNLSISGRLPFIKVEDLNNCKKYQISGREYSNDDENVIPPQSVIFPKRGAAIELNKVRINVEAILMDTNLMAITPNDKVNVEFLYYEILKDGLHKIADTSTIPQINNKHIEPYVVALPLKKEQQRIASCLSSLDEVITAHCQKSDALKEHKKGLMQNLFPQEGETVPKWRFKEFVGDGEWLVKMLGDVATFLKGKGISKADIVKNGNLPCIRYGELYTHYSETISTIKSYTNLSADDLVFSEANDVIIPASGETQIDIATASCVLENGIALGGDLNIIRSKINGVFLSYYLNNAKKKEIAQMAQGNAVVHLYPNQLRTLIMQIPKMKEQQRIASCLSSLDELITAQAEKIEQLKFHKKGLMQRLFPKIQD